MNVDIALCVCLLQLSCRDQVLAEDSSEMNSICKWSVLIRTTQCAGHQTLTALQPFRTSHDYHGNMEKEDKTDRKGEHGIPGTGHLQDASPCSCVSGNGGIWHVCVAIWRPEGCQPCSTFASSGNELNSPEWKKKKYIKKFYNGKSFQWERKAVRPHSAMEKIKNTFPISLFFHLQGRD